ncbi:MAG: hypothetical protein KIT42_02900 [Rhodocyclaceae bacterium]|nr:hypothetical protein [Rhodocyclaceae bacterium]
MSFLDAVTGAIGDIVAYVVGRTVGRTFNLEKMNPHTLGEYVLLGILAGAAIAVTLIYS